MAPSGESNADTSSSVADGADVDMTVLLERSSMICADREGGLISTLQEIRYAAKWADSTISQMNEHIEAKEAGLAEAAALIKDLGSRLEKECQKRVDADVTAVQKLENELASARQAEVEAREQACKADESEQAVKLELNNARKKLKAEELELKKATARLKELESRLDDMEGTKDGNAGADVRALENELASARKAEAASRAQAHKAEESEQATKQKHASTQSELAELRKELDECHTKLKQRDTDGKFSAQAVENARRAQAEEMKKQLEAATTAQRRAEEELKSCRSNLEVCKRELDTTEKQLGEARSAATEARLESEEAKRTLEQAQKTAAATMDDTGHNVQETPRASGKSDVGGAFAQASEAEKRERVGRKKASQAAQAAEKSPKRTEEEEAAQQRKAAAKANKETERQKVAVEKAVEAEAATDKLAAKKAVETTRQRGSRGGADSGSSKVKASKMASQGKGHTSSSKRLFNLRNSVSNVQILSWVFGAIVLIQAGLVISWYAN